MHSNGNSFSSGQPANISATRPAEPWIIRLLGPVQDRGSV